MTAEKRVVCHIGFFIGATVEVNVAANGDVTVVPGGEPAMVNHVASTSQEVPHAGEIALLWLLARAADAATKKIEAQRVKPTQGKAEA